MMKRLFLLAVSLVCLLSVLQAQQVHKVKRKETLWSISKQYGVTVDDLVSANPEMRAADYKLRKGSFVSIPAPRPAVQPEAPSAPRGMESLCVGVLLPLEASGTEGSRSLEFYRGLLMAAKVEARASGKEIRIVCLNEPAAGMPLDEPLAGFRRAGVQLMVGPVYPDHFAEASAFAADRRIRLVVPFSSKVEEVRTNPQVVLLNTPDGYEWLYASRLLARRFAGDLRIVLIRTEAAKKRACADYLARNLSGQEGVTVREVGADFSDEAMRAAVSPTGRTLFLPDCADRVPTEKLLAALQRFREKEPGLKASLVGYPEWLDFVPQCAPALAAQDTYLFALHHFDDQSRPTADFIHRYQTWSHTSLLPVNPRMALLGYDAARHLFSLLLQKGADASLSAPPAVPLLQSVFTFGQLAGGGFVNRGVFLLHVTAGGKIERVAVNQ